MVDNPLRGPEPIGGLGGYGNRPSPQQGAPGRHGTRDAAVAPTDRVSVHHGARTTLRLLRERVLARTRLALDLPAATVVPEFAEVVDG
jgi:hypothetical protein